MRVDEFDYELPVELIAQKPAEPRDSARLLVVHRASGTLEHRRFGEIGDFLEPGDCLVVNDTQVVPARIIGKRARTAGAWEGLFVRVRPEGWEFMCRTRGKPNAGEWIHLADGNTRLRLANKLSDGNWIIEPLANETVWKLLERVGQVPLPCYIHDGIERPGDRKRYQTVYARQPGAVAAPTAGMHFTVQLMQRLKSNGIALTHVTLHVGPGTFRPVKVDNIEDHRMQAEWFDVPEATARQLEKTRAEGHRIVAVGTTTVRALESTWRTLGRFAAHRGDTEAFIHPPYRCGGFDALVTNFHLPRSTLLMLVASFVGLPLLKKAYAEAIQRQYRFYSYGDAMLII